MMKNIAVVLYRPKYSGNVGSTARACLNMGCREIIMVSPQDWKIEEALPLATHHARDLIDNITVVPDLRTALKNFNYAYGTTARTGGWRRGILTPDKAADKVQTQLAQGAKVALVFGPENFGLTNEEIELCGSLVTIPTNPEMASLNLSQAVLILLYECFKKCSEIPFRAGGYPKDRLVTNAERELCLKNIQDTLVTIDYIKDENKEYFTLPFRRFLSGIKLRLHEYNMLMGLCRQVKWVALRAGICPEAESDQKKS